MTTHLIDRFLAACGVGASLPLRVSCPGYPEPVVRQFHQPFVVLGRDPGADLCLNSPQVSPCHAYLQVIAGSVFCVDLQSVTGTHWPTGPERNGWLAEGQPLRVGPFTVEVAEDLLDVADTFGPAPQWNPLLSRSVQASRLASATLELLNTADKQGPRQLNRMLAMVGSAPGCNVRLVSSTVSSFHCALMRTPMGLWVMDLLGRNGIRVNGTTMRYTQLNSGDELQVGKFRLRIGIEGLPRPAPAAAENGVYHEPNTRAERYAPPPERAVPADLAAVSMPDMMLSRREDVNLLPLVQQFHLMQQQLFDQFQQAMLMVVKMFGQMHREQTDILHRDLDRLQGLTRNVQALQDQWNAQLAHVTRNPRPADPTPSRVAASASPAHGPAPRTTTPDSKEAAPSEAIHAWLEDRLTTLQNERQTQWQKIFKFLGSK